MINAFIPARRSRVRTECDGRAVRLWTGPTKHLLTADEAIRLADALVDAAERLTTTGRKNR